MVGGKICRGCFLKRDGWFVTPPFGDPKKKEKAVQELLFFHIGETILLNAETPFYELTKLGQGSYIYNMILYVSV